MQGKGSWISLRFQSALLQAKYDERVKKAETERSTASEQLQEAQKREKDLEDCKNNLECNLSNLRNTLQVTNLQDDPAPTIDCAD